MRVGLLFVITCVLGGVFVKASPLRSLRNQPVKMEPQHRHIISNTTAGSSNALLPVFGSRSMTSQKSRRFLNAVVLVAGGNLVFNTVRYDPSIKWQFRLPRILWEICIMVTATITSEFSSKTPTMYLLLAFMLGTTAMVDIFVWAPLFALLAGVDNQDCTGGIFTGRPYICRNNYTKERGRLLVTVQSLFGGLFYLSSAILALSEYTIHRDRVRAAHQAQFLHQWNHQENQGNAAMEPFKGNRR